MTAERVVYECSSCCQHFPDADAMRAHVLECPSHPLADFKRSAETWQTKALEAEERQACAERDRDALAKALVEAARPGRTDCVALNPLCEGECERCVKEAVRQLQSVQGQLAEARAAALYYGEHHGLCKAPKYATKVHSDCDCGLSDFLLGDGINRYVAVCVPIAEQHRQFGEGIAMREKQLAALRQERAATSGFKCSVCEDVGMVATDGPAGVPHTVPCPDCSRAENSSSPPEEES